MTEKELERIEDESNDREQMRLEGLEIEEELSQEEKDSITHDERFGFVIEEDEAKEIVEELLEADDVETQTDKIVAENINILEQLIEQFEGYKFRFFVYGTDTLIINLKTNKEVTPEELMNSDQNFQIKDANYSEEHKIVEVDVVLFPK